MIRGFVACCFVLAVVPLWASRDAAFSQAEVDAALALREVVSKEAKVAPSSTYASEKREWLKSQDWNSVTGVCHFVDKAGCRHVFGVGFASDNDMGREMAHMYAQQNLAYVIAPSVVKSTRKSKAGSSSAIKVSATMSGVMTVYSCSVKMKDGRSRYVCVVEQDCKVPKATKMGK